MGLVPLDAALVRRDRLILRIAVALLGAVIAVAAAHTLLGIGGSALDDPVRDWASAAAYVLVALIVALRALRITRARGPWTVLAIGVSLYAAGNLLWSLWLEHVDSPPIPSACDALWLSLYPASYVGIVLLARMGRGQVPPGVWLDGLIAGLSIATLGAALVFDPVLDAATGGAVAVATNLAYPIGDLLLAALVVAILAVRGWRVGRAWALLGAGFLVLCGADWIYLLQVANGSYDSSSVANLFYMSGVALLAIGAWQPHEPAPTARRDSWWTLLVPAFFTFSVLGLIIVDHFQRISLLALFLGVATLAAALARTAITFRDVRLLAETRVQATTDHLTSLPNRRAFMHQLDAAIVTARASGGSTALLMIDLDHFKELNDTLGHHAGDLVLGQIGPRLTGALRTTDRVARLGGDEFAALLQAPSGPAAAVALATKLRAAIAEPFELEGLSVRVGASVGIALFPDHAGSASQLLQHADMAMYDAKTRRSGQQIYAHERDTSSRDRLALGGELERALTSGEIEVRFQPKADAHTRRIVGAEALSRWNHPERGLLPPVSFVPLIEQAGLSRMLLRRVLDIAVAQAAAWRAAGHDVHVAVNTTPADLLDTALPDEIASVLEHYGLPPANLVIELTESSVLADPMRVRDVLAKLGELGVGVSLDDFGTGFSSLSHLKTLPVGEVKIDRSFVAQIATNPADAAIVASTIGLAHALGMRVVAEGVEDEPTWSRLALAGADMIQGHALTRALPAAEFAVLLDSQRPAVRSPAGRH